MALKKGSEKSPPHASRRPAGESNGMTGGPASASAARNYGGGEPYIFRAPPQQNACGFSHQGGLDGRLRMSGVKGAHRVGKK